MIVRRYLTWMQSAPAEARAAATGALARAYLFSDMGLVERGEAIQRAQRVRGIELAAIAC